MAMLELFFAGFFDKWCALVRFGALLGVGRTSLLKIEQIVFVESLTWHGHSQKGGSTIR